MRAYRFVNALGSAVETAGREVADAADVTSAHRGGLSDSAARVGIRVSEELLRQMARETAGLSLERAEFEARGVRVTDDSSPGTDPIGLDLGVSVHVDLPSYEATNVVLATVVHTSQIPAESAASEPDPIRDRMASLAERTSAAFLLVVDDAGTRAIPAQSLLALSEPISTQSIEQHLYGRSLGRFVEELAEGFVGVSRVGEDQQALALDPEREGQLRDWARATDLQGVYALRISETRPRTESSLSAFLD
ncbi:hypothetical protein HTSR_0803 [Halodesulfurarchaeum formicicum]|uniref:Uncharacterized protein n=1 Tax=Halodesulfurarchaeum formicicum TaxID=1873524 RepID=A0A1D8S3R3_9EURY|nr:hypothetical protein [Halodesulfurarchaeum formicicum]AOW79990.1 hypothetical protein HTSR_0803 [Halodesulfurarchaeum formicicum]